MAQQTKNTFTILTTNFTKQQLNKPMRYSWRPNL